MSHAKLSPSGSSRWAVCTASVGFIDAHAHELPPSGGVYADEGTQAHEYAKSMLLGKKVELPPGFSDPVSRYVEFIRSQTSLSETLIVERRVTLFYSDIYQGTVDAAQVTPERIFVGDLKYGAGVSVDAVENKQLAIYAESLIREYEEIDDVAGSAEVSINIFQPRDRNNPEPVRNWTLKRSELRDFVRREIEPAVDIIRNHPEQAKFVANPDAQCRFCPAKGLCKAYANYGLDQTPLGIELFEVVSEKQQIELPQPDSLTREQRIKIILARKPLEKWLEAVEQQEVAELMNGAAPAGMKLVEGKSNRAWSDEEAAEKLLKNYLASDEVRPPGNIVSPAAAEKLLAGKETSTRFENRLSSLITKPEGKPTLVPETDKRQALELNPTKMFAHLVDESEPVI